MWWIFMREAAIHRHRFVNLAFEGGCPRCWCRHMAMIMAVYGW